MELIKKNKIERERIVHSNIEERERNISDCLEFYGFVLIHGLNSVEGHFTNMKYGIAGKKNSVVPFFPLSIFFFCQILDFFYMYIYFFYFFFSHLYIIYMSNVEQGHSYDTKPKTADFLPISRHMHVFNDLSFLHFFSNIICNGIHKRLANSVAKYPSKIFLQIFAR